MTNRGRPSAASLAVVTAGAIEVVPRARPPEDLTEEQAHEWYAVVNRLPAEWFPRETHAVLAQYCRHVVAARRVAQLIQAAEREDPLDIGNYDKLLKIQERESRAMASLATRMRLTQQTTYDREKKKPKTAKRPWDDPEG